MGEAVFGIRYYHIIGVATGLAAVASFFFVPLACQKLIAAGWMSLPPVWFFFEFHYVRKHRPGSLDSLKESQESAAKVWAGVAAALAILDFK